MNTAPEAVVLAAVGGLVATRVAISALPALAYSRAGTARSTVALLAAGAAVLAPGAPTGLLAADMAMKAAFAAVVALSASRAPRSSWLVASTVAAVGAGSGRLGIVSFALLGAAVAAALGRRWGTVVGAAWGAVLAQVLLRLWWPRPVGGTAVLAGLAAAAIVAGAYAEAQPASRRRAGIAAASVAGVAAVFLGLAGAAAVSSHRDLVAGMNLAGSGLRSASAGELGRAAEDLGAASSALHRADEHLEVWWAKPARVLPVAGRFLYDAQVAVAAAARVVEDVGQVADLSTADELKVRDGTISLAGLEALRGKLEGAVRSLATARDAIASPSSAPWIPGPVQARLDRLTARLDGALDDARSAAAAAAIAPQLLGADGPRHWFLAVHTPAEQRGAGGVMGNYGELVATEGRVRLGRFGRTRELKPPEAPSPHALSPDVAASLSRYDSFGVTRYFQNAMHSPDFTVDASAIEELSPVSGGPDVEGVVAIDPLGLAAIMELTGPVTVPSWPHPIDTANVRRVLLHDQYVVLTGEVREDFLGEVARAVVEALTAQELGSPTEIARALAPAVAGKHLMLHSAHPGEQEVIERLGAAGQMQPLDGGDFLQVVTQNTTETKIEWFLRRRVSYEVVYDPASGAVEAGLEVQLHNGAPSTGLPPYVIGATRPEDLYPPPGHNRTWLSIYSPLALEGATLDGELLVLSRGRELGRNVYGGFVTIPPGATSTVRLELEGSVDPARAYSLLVGAQPQVTPDRLSVAVQPAPGWQRPPPPAPSELRLSRISPRRPACPAVPSSDPGEGPSAPCLAEDPGTDGSRRQVGDVGIKVRMIPE